MAVSLPRHDPLISAHPREPRVAAAAVLEATARCETNSPQQTATAVRPWCGVMIAVEVGMGMVRLGIFEWVIAMVTHHLGC